MSEQDFRSMARANAAVASRLRAAVEQRCHALVG
jgi:hypothetical protein